jgi:poly(3-hydroxybutyrate) depolymerase
MGSGRKVGRLGAAWWLGLLVIAAACNEDFVLPGDDCAGEGCGCETACEAGEACVDGVCTCERAHYTDVKLTAGGEDRDYRLYVPKSASSAGAPVVFVFHGGGGCGTEFYEKKPEWVCEAEKNGFILVFPTALTYCYWKGADDEDADPDDECGGGCLGVSSDPDHHLGMTLCVKTSWDEGNLNVRRPLCTDAEIPPNTEVGPSPPANDFVFVQAVLDDIQAKGQTVKLDQVYAAGFSNGAAFTQRLMVEMPDTFAAFAASGERMQSDEMAVDPPPSLFFAIGTEDPAFGSATLNADLVEEMTFREKFVAKLLTTLQLAASRAFAVGDWKCDGTDVTTWTYSTTTSTAPYTNELLFNVIPNLGHEYPPCMPARLWQFFKAYSLAP